MQILIGPEDPARRQAVVIGLAPRLDYRMVAECCPGQVQQWHPSPSGLSGPRLTRVLRSFSGNLGRAWQLVRSLAPGSIVYSTGETWGLPVALAGAALRDRCFTHVVYGHRVFSPVWLRFLRATRRRLAVEGWICVTQHQAHLLRGALGPEAAPVAVVSQGVDTKFFDPTRASSLSDRPYLLSIGAEMRDYGLFFEAAQDLDVEIVVKASSAWMTAARTDFPSAPANVQIITRRLSYIELRDLYAGAAAVVAPLYDTPQAAGITTILEGMAMQKCVVTTRSRGLPDILVHDRTGIICEPAAGALAEALAQVLAAPDRWEVMAHEARRAVCAQVSIEQHARQIADFLVSVSEGRPGQLDP